MNYLGYLKMDGETTQSKDSSIGDGKNRARYRKAVGPKPKGPSDRKGKAPKGKKAPLKTTFPQERKYQGIKLAKSGRSLSEIKSFMKTGTMALTDEYTSKNDLKTLSSLEYGLSNLALTRGQTRKLLAMKFGPRKSNIPNREEVLAEFAIGGRIPLNWKRDGNLVRKGKYPTPSEPGSSKGKIGKTKVKGANRVLRDFKAMVRGIQNLLRQGKGASPKGLAGAVKSVKAAAKLKP